MTDYFLGVPPQSMEWELRSNVSRFQSPMGGVTRTLERVGSRWAATWRWDAVAGENAARLKSFLATQRGGGNRFWAYDPGYTMRGAYSAAELLTNTAFSGTTGWTGALGGVLTASDGVLRVTRDAPTANYQANQNPTYVQYAPHAGRALGLAGRGPAQLRTLINDNVVAAGSGSAPGLNTAALVLLGSGGDTFTVYESTAAGTGIAWDYFEVQFASVARCALVDNGPNAVLRSDELDNAAWVKSQLTTTANNHNAPNGSTTAEDLVESTGSAEHAIYQSWTRASSAADICCYGYFKDGSLNRDPQMYAGDMAGGHYATCVFDLGAGTAGSVGLVGSAANGRAYIANVGNGWYFCSLIVQVPASTAAIIRVDLYNGSTVTYTGDGTSYIRAWRLGGYVGSVPTRGMQTTTTADPDGVVQTGAALHLKGLPASTSGLLLAGDWVEFITPTYSELKRVTAPLNSDAAGLGYLQFEPILRASPVDNAAVIIRKPMGRFMLDEPTVKWSQGRAGVYSVSFTAIEDVAA